MHAHLVRLQAVGVPNLGRGHRMDAELRRQDLRAPVRLIRRRRLERGVPDRLDQLGIGSLGAVAPRRVPLQGGGFPLRKPMGAAFVGSQTDPRAHGDVLRRGRRADPRLQCLPLFERQGQCRCWFRHAAAITPCGIL